MRGILRRFNQQKSTFVMLKDIEIRSIWPNVCFMLLIVLVNYIAGTSSLSMKRAERNVGLMKPPIDTIRGNRRGGGEYGIRQLSAGESKATVEAWQKSLGVISGNRDIEMYELLEILSKILNVMPGKMPQRYEYMLFGELSDGVIECISAAYCGKVTCPWEMDIILIAQCPTFSDEKTRNMVDFIKTACLENACLPNFAPLGRFSTTLKIEKFIEGEYKSDNDEYALAIATAYQKANKGACRMMCLDSVPEVYTFPYWYSISVPRPDTGISIPLFFRQTINCMSDFQLTFTSPLSGTGTGRGTVGGALILRENTAQRLIPGASPKFFAAMRREVGKRIVHPNLTQIAARVVTKRPWQEL